MLVDAVRLDADHPLFLEIEVEPAAQGPFGVTVESGRAYSAHASGQAMLGWQIADDLRKHVGDRIDIDGTAARRGDHLRADRGDHRHEHHGAVVRGAHPFVERTREFGVLRAVGWSRSRLLALVVGEAVGISLFGAAVGAGLAFVLTSALEQRIPGPWSATVARPAPLARGSGQRLPVRPATLRAIDCSCIH